MEEFQNISTSVVEYPGMSGANLTQVKDILENEITGIDCVFGAYPSDYGLNNDLFYPQYQKISSFVFWKRKVEPGPNVNFSIFGSSFLKSLIDNERNKNMRKILKILILEINNLSSVIKNFSQTVTDPQKKLVYSYIEEKIHKTIMNTLNTLPAFTKRIPKPAHVYFPIGHGGELWKAPRKLVPKNCALATRVSCGLPTQQGQTGFDEIKTDITNKLQNQNNNITVCNVEQFYKNIEKNKDKIKNIVFNNQPFGLYLNNIDYPNLFVSLYLTIRKPNITKQGQSVPSIDIYDSGLVPFSKMSETNFTPYTISAEPNLNMLIQDPQKPNKVILLLDFFQKNIPLMFRNSLLPTQQEVANFFVDQNSFVNFLVNNVHIFKNHPEFDQQNIVTLLPYFIESKMNTDGFIWFIIEKLGNCVEFNYFTHELFQFYPGTYYHLVCRGISTQGQGPIPTAAFFNYPQLLSVRQQSAPHWGGKRHKTKRHKKSHRKTKKISKK